MNTTKTRQHVHTLVDQLPAAQLAALEGLLATMIDPVARAIAHAPVDDEPFTEEDRQAVAEAEQWLKHNEPIPLETVLTDFGLSRSDWERMGETPADERG